MDYYWSVRMQILSLWWSEYDCIYCYKDGVCNALKVIIISVCEEIDKLTEKRIWNVCNALLVIIIRSASVKRLTHWLKRRYGTCCSKILLILKTEMKYGDMCTHKFYSKYYIFVSHLRVLTHLRVFTKAKSPNSNKSEI